MRVLNQKYVSSPTYIKLGFDLWELFIEVCETPILQILFLILLLETFIAWNVFCEVPMRKLLLFFYDKSCYIYELCCFKKYVIGF